MRGQRPNWGISIHALLAESDAEAKRTTDIRPPFLSTLSLRRATAKHFSTLHNILISIHALLAESDTRAETIATEISNFYPRSPCGERRVHYDNYNLHCVISIHALLAESDICVFWMALNRRLFLSTLSLRRATIINRNSNFNQKFLSTLSLRRATYMGVTVLGIQHHFYPRSPCGERQPTTGRNDQNNMISIHALLAESDYWPCVFVVGRAFLSTLSLRRATTYQPNAKRGNQSISIHALLAESDKTTQLAGWRQNEFLSTLSLRRATIWVLRS